MRNWSTCCWRSWHPRTSGSFSSATFATWAESKQAYVADFLERAYLLDKAGVRDALSDVPPLLRMGKKPPPLPDRIAAVGPWGAVRRR